MSATETTEKALPVHKEIVGICVEISEKNGWTNFHINTGGQYPVKLGTKKHDIINAARNVGQQRAVWGFLESEGDENPNRPGTNYVNRWLDSVELAGEQAAEATPIEEQSAAPHPAESADAPPPPVDWDGKERRIVRQACLKAAVAFWVAVDPLSVPTKVTDLAQEWEAWVYRPNVTYAEPEELLPAKTLAGGLPSDDDIPFAPA